MSVPDCAAVWLLCILYHSYLDSASPRRGTSECVMYHVSRVGVCHFEPIYRLISGTLQVTLKLHCSNTAIIKQIDENDR